MLQACINLCGNGLPTCQSVSLCLRLCGSKWMLVLGSWCLWLCLRVLACTHNMSECECWRLVYR